MYGFMYLAVGMFPSCDMSSGGKLAPRKHGVNQFFAANEALAIAAPAIPWRRNRASHHGTTSSKDVWTSKQISRKPDVQPRKPAWILACAAHARCNNAHHGRKRDAS
jgi:hypothetical protein